jgi:hypothetical protein
MADARRRRAPRAKTEDALGRQWAERIGSGTDVAALAAEVEQQTPADAAAALTTLAHVAGAGAVPLLARLAGSAARAVASAAVEALGAIRDVSAAETLQELTRTSENKQLQKDARRSLYRLSTQGIRVASGEPREPATLGSRAATIYRVVASSFDGAGNRSIWFGADRPLGGIYMLAASINDVNGMTDFVARDTTRKRFAEQESTMREKDIAAWAELPVEYGKQLVQEAVETARGAGAGIPPAYPIWAELVGEPAEPFSEPLVYRELSGFEMRMHPTLEGETPRLFEQPEVESWFFPPDRVRKWVQQLGERSASRLIVTPESEESRQERILREAVRELVTARELHGLRRRLEETAYILLRTDRQADARRAVAAAVTIEEERPLRPPHPFVRALVERSLRIGLQVERSGYEPARLARAP